MIKRITTTGFMGTSTDLKLTGRDLIVGVNGAGKTKVRNALEFALTGSIFKSSQNGMLFEDFASSQTMECQVALDQFVLTRGIEDKVKDDTHKFSGIYQIESKSGIITGQDKVNEELDHLILPIAFTYQELMRMNSSDRRTKFFEMLQMEDPDDMRIVDALHVLKVSDEIIQEIIDKEGIDAMIAHAKAKESYYNKRIKDLKGATKSIAAIKNEIDVNVGKLASITKELESLRKQKETVVSEINVIKEKNGVNLDNIARKQKLTDKYNALEDGYLETKQKYIEELYLSLEDYKKRLSVSTDNIEQIESQKALSENELSLLRQELSDEKEHLYNLLEVKAKVLTSISHLNSAINEVEEAKGVCPLTNQACTTDLTEYVASKKEKLVSINEKLNITNGDQIKAAEIVSNLENKISNLEAGLRKDNEELSYQRKEQNRNSLLIENLNKDIAETSSQIDSYQEKVTMLKERIDEIKVFETDSADDKLMLAESLIESIKERTKQVDAINEALNLFKAQQQTIKEREEIELTLKMWADSKVSLNKLKADTMTSYLAPIEKEVTNLMQDAGFVYEFKFITETLNKEQKLSFGLVDDGKIATALSTGEFLLAVIGMMIALNKIYRPQLRLLIVDEILSLDADSLHYLTNSQLIASNFDNIILLSPMQVPSGIYEVTEL